VTKHLTRIDKIIERHLGEGVNTIPLNQAAEKFIDYRGISPNKTTSGIPLITARNVRKGYLDFSDIEYIPEQEYLNWMSRGEPKVGDVLITTEAPLGNTAMYPKSGRYALAQRMICIRPKQGVFHGDFLRHYFLSDAGKKQLEIRSTGSTAKGIKSSELRKISIPDLTYSEQKKIADSLSKWDNAMSITYELLESKKLLRKGIMQKLLTGERRFPEFNETWNEVKLGEVAKRVNKRNTVDEKNVLTISAQMGLVNQQKYYKKNVASNDLSTYYLLKKGDFAYNKSYSSGYPYGAIKRLELYDAGVVSSLYICFDLNHPKCDKDFFTHYFEAGMLNHGIYRIAQEGARNHGLLNISVHDFFDIKLNIPGLAEQKKIASTLNTINKELNILQQELAAIKTQKTGLMQQLLTGKKRLKVPEAA